MRSVPVTQNDPESPELFWARKVAGLKFLFFEKQTLAYSFGTPRLNGCILLCSHCPEIFFGILFKAASLLPVIITKI